MAVTILGIESSCDDTSAAVISDGYLLSNVIAGQKVHLAYGGVVPELASRAHQANIVPVVDVALREAGVTPADIQGVAFTRGPGLLGSLLVGTSFAKGFALSRNIPLLDVNHLRAHVLSCLILQREKENRLPSFPFLSLLVSGGHTQLLVVKSPFSMEIIGETIDDAAGEAFDKCAKVMGLGYPGGPVVDRNAKLGNPNAFLLNKPRIKGLDFSFSGLKTSFLYLLKDKCVEDSGFIEKEQNNLCASLQKAIVDILIDKLVKAAKSTGIRDVVLAGGVSANSGLRDAATVTGREKGWNLFLPELRFTTDNAAMVAITGYYQYLEGIYGSHDAPPMARYKLMEVSQ